MAKKKIMNKTKKTDWKFITLLISLLMVGLSVFALNQRTAYRSNAKPIDEAPRTATNKEVQAIGEAVEEYEKKKVMNNNYNKGVYHTAEGGFCTKDYCYSPDGKTRTPRQKYTPKYNNIKRNLGIK